MGMRLVTICEVEYHKREEMLRMKTGVLEMKSGYR